MRRLATASLVSVISVTLTGLLCAPAYADDHVSRLEGADPGPSPDPLTMLLLYVVLPLAVVGLIAVIVLLPGAMRANRYRPTKPWNATPVWFAGPAEPVKAVRSATTGDLVTGGARGDW